MAKRAKLTVVSDKVEDRAPEEVRKAVEEIIRQKGLASEYQSSSGGLTRSFVKRFSLDAKAATVAIGMKKQDEQKRQAFISDSLRLWKDLGYFDQLDAFSDPVAKLEEIVAELKARIPNAQRDDEVMGALTT